MSLPFSNGRLKFKRMFKSPAGKEQAGFVNFSLLRFFGHRRRKVAPVALVQVPDLNAVALWLTGVEADGCLFDQLRRIGCRQ